MASHDADPSRRIVSCLCHPLLARICRVSLTATFVSFAIMISLNQHLLSLRSGQSVHTYTPQTSGRRTRKSYSQSSRSIDIKRDETELETKSVQLEAGSLEEKGGKQRSIQRRKESRVADIHKALIKELRDIESEAPGISIHSHSLLGYMQL